MTTALVQHTPGEWKTILREDGCQIYSDQYGAIASINHLGKHKEEHEANAKVIAETPKFIKALVAIANTKGKLGQVEAEAFRNIAQKALETII